MKPNIVLILMDDMGWKDLGCMGSSFYETPHIDALCSEGMRFERAYAACPVCSPSRASLLTGQYPVRTGITDWIDEAGRIHPLKGRLIDAPYRKYLSEDHVTLAEILQKNGYHTWHVGKWHLGSQDHYPEKYGFDLSIGMRWRGRYFSPYGMDTLPDGPEGEYLTDRLTDEAIRLIQNRNDDAPFFLNLWHYAVHVPIQAKEPDIRKFEAKRSALGLDWQQEIIPGERHPTLAHHHERVARRMVQSDPVYAAMIWNLDENIGRLVQAVRDTGIQDNTIFLFYSDNGGLATAEGSPTCNLPAIEGKGWMYEGGTRVPMFAVWPGHIRPGSMTNVPVVTPDFYPTLLDMAGISFRPPQPCDGISFLPVLSGGNLPERPLFWHYPHYGNQGGTPGASVILGKYKLIHFFEDQSDHLFDLENDISEKNDLTAAHPEIAERLRIMLKKWLADVNAKIPEVNPDFRAEDIE